jgi:hypothetical protein
MIHCHAAQRSKQMGNGIYKLAYDYLLQKNGITEEILNKHLVPESDKPNDLSEIYKRFCNSAQNKQMDTNVIGGSIGGINNLATVLYKFSPSDVAKKYNKNDNLKLLDVIINELRPKGKVNNASTGIWPKYCKSIIDSAHFLSQFNSSEDFYKWADYFANDSRAKPALPLLISLEIKGIGFALACDLLKELGYSNFGKPDVHLKEIFLELGIIEKENNDQTQDINTLKAIDTIAEENAVTSYSVDKVFWLIGSGNFYRATPRIDIGSCKKEFIAYIKSKN